MDNNWKDVAETIFKQKFGLATEPKENEITLDWEFVWQATEQCMNLVFEATKKQCADNAEMTGITYGNDKSVSDYEVSRESILNVTKPNL